MDPIFNTILDTIPAPVDNSDEPLQFQVAMLDYNEFVGRIGIGRIETNAGGDASVKKAPVKKVKKPGRNDPCPCGKLRPNGLPMKYKDCCGKE